MDVFIKNYHVEFLLRRANESSSETGGILVGKKEGESFYITHIIEDTESTDRSIVNFTRTIKNIWDELQNIVENNEDIDYIGEWHTHPKLFNRPSAMDDSSIREIVSSSHYQSILEVLLCISTGIEIRFWIYKKDIRTEVNVKIQNI